MSQGPLSGIRVFDLTLAMVGPWASMQLGAMGADVIHVEQPEGSRAAGGFVVPPTISGTSIGYISWNMNKRGLTLDLKSPDDRARAYELLKTCDVFLMNMRPDVAARLGVDYETVSSVNDQIVYCSVTGWGQTGPMRELPGADGQIQNFTGGASANGAEDGEPEIYRHHTQFDATTGNYACMSILMGLVARKRTGKGQRIDISMLRATTAMQTPRIGEYLLSKQNPPRLGHKAQSTAPDRAFLCADERWLGISVTNNEEWVAFCKAIGQQTLLDDARFNTNSDRVDHRKELDAVLEPVFHSMPLDYWQLEFAKVGLPSARPMRWDEIRYNQQVLENTYIQPVDTTAWGKVWTGGAPWHFSNTPTQWFSTPTLGQHNDEIVQELQQHRADAGAARTPAREQ